MFHGNRSARKAKRLRAGVCCRIFPFSMFDPLKIARTAVVN